MEPWQSWLLAIVLGGGALWYYTSFDKNGRQRKPARSASLGGQPDQLPAVPARKRQEKPSVKSKPLVLTPEPVENSASQGAQKAATKQGKKRKNAKPGPQPSVTPTVTIQKSAPVDEEADTDAIDDGDWAKQLAANKAGVNFAPSGAQQQKQQSRKIGSSPSFAAQDSQQMTSSRDVSDMLEQPAPGPSVLRLTGDIKEKKQAPKTAAAPQPTETKKQRQNRQKKEEARLQREEDEKQRRVLMEQQRRSAREARGEPARNGMSVASAPAASAWVPSAPHETATTAAQAIPRQDAGSGPLLDTFEQDNLSSASSADAGNTTTPGTNDSVLGTSIPSEEEQMQMLKEMDGWEEVPNKSNKKKQRKPATVSQEEDDAPTPKENKPVPPLIPSRISSVKQAPSSNAAKNDASSRNNFAALQESESSDSWPPAAGHPLDSDWAV